MSNAKYLADFWTHTTAGVPVRIISTTWTTVLSSEVYHLATDGIEMYQGTVLEHPECFHLLAEMDGARLTPRLC